MNATDVSQRDFPDLYITNQLDLRPSTLPDYRREMLAVHELAARMADKPDDVLPRFVDLAMEITGGVSAGISLYEDAPGPGVFRWKFLRGILSPFENATTPRDFSPCGVTLDQNSPVLSRHPERYYGWISEAGIVVPELLLVPLYIRGTQPLGTLWIVSEAEGHFTRSHARAMAELASFVSITLRVREADDRLHLALSEQEMLAKEMSHRVKNLFALADGMIRVGIRTAPDMKTFADDLTGRLHALASAHELVSRNLREAGSTPRPGDIGSLIRAVVKPHQGRGEAGSRIRMTGPNVPCGNHALNAVALIFHELATNSAKHGALGSDGGFVDITWRLKHGDLEVIWLERGGPPVFGPPVMSGFGNALVNKSVTGQLGGSITYDWNPAGLAVTSNIPQSRLID